MRITTIFADDHLLNEIKDLANQEKRSVADLIRDAPADRTDRHHFSSIQPKHCRNFELLP